MRGHWLKHYNVERSPHEALNNQTPYTIPIPKQKFLYLKTGVSLGALQEYFIFPLFNTMIALIFEGRLK